MLKITPTMLQTYVFNITLLLRLKDTIILIKIIIVISQICFENYTDIICIENLWRILPTLFGHMKQLKLTWQKFDENCELKFLTILKYCQRNNPLITRKDSFFCKNLIFDYLYKKWPFYLVLYSNDFCSSSWSSSSQRKMMPSLRRRINYPG